MPSWSRSIEKAAASLREGLEETLTLHRLGLFEELGRSLETTNGIENLMGQVAQRIDKVNRWHHSPQRHRWMALALSEAESRMRRITGYADLPKLQAALTDSIPDRE
jgi:transposase-like protein